MAASGAAMDGPESAQRGVAFAPVDRNHHCMLGLASQAGGRQARLAAEPSFESIDFAACCWNDGGFSVYEGDQRKGPFGHYAPGDRIEVVRNPQGRIDFVVNVAKQKRCKSNCDARHVTCYPRAGVSHVTPGRPCHMLPWGARVTCYPGRACRMLPQGARVTCYLGAPVSLVIPGRACHMLPWAGVSHVTPGRPCHMLPWGARVTIYPRAGVSHVTLGGRVTCNPRAPVSHVTLGRPCHILAHGGCVTCNPGRACHM